MSTIRYVALLALLLTLCLARPVAAQGEGTVEGEVTMPAGAPLPEGLEVELLFLPNGQGPPVIKSAPLPADGTFRFTGVDSAPQHRYLVRVKLDGEDNFSDLLAFESGQRTLQVTLRLLERTTDASALVLPQVNMILDARPEGWMVVALYRYENQGEQIIQNEQRPPVRLTLPAEASGLQFGEALRPAGLIELPDGFAYSGPFMPGETPVVFSYLLPYEAGTQQLTLPLSAAPARLRLFVPELGQRTEVAGLRALGVQEGVEGRLFQVFEGEALAATEPLTLRLEGLPPAPTPEAGSEPRPDGPRVAPISPLERLPWWAPLIPVGMALLALGLYLAVRPLPSQAAQRAALRQRRDALIAEIASLDIRFESGAMGEQSHARQRAALKAELKGLLRRLGKND